MPEHLPDTTRPLHYTITADACAMALEGLTEAVRNNMEHLQEAEDTLFSARQERIRRIAALRRQKKRAALIGRRGGAAPEVRTIVEEFREQRDTAQREIDRYLGKIEFFRSLFAQQVVDTTEFGFGGVAEEWAGRFLEMETPFDQERVAPAEAIRATHSPERRKIAALWIGIRSAIHTALGRGEQLLPVFAQHMQQLTSELRQQNLPRVGYAYGQ